MSRPSFGVIYSKYVINCAGVSCNYLVTDVAIMYDSQIIVNKIYFEIFTHSFVSAFSGTLCINKNMEL